MAKKQQNRQQGKNPCCRFCFLREITIYLQNNQCREMENMRKAERIEIAKRMLASGKLTYEDIATFTDLTLEEIKALAVQKTA